MGIALLWLVLASLMSGIVYGFVGFGAALIFMPIAVALVDPVLAVAAFAVCSLGSVFTVLPQAWRQANKRATMTMIAAAIVLEPLGVWVLRSTDPEALRWAVSGVVIVTLVILMAGWRYRQTPGVPAWLFVGAGVGFLGGSTGINGPFLVLFQLGGKDAVVRTRANTIVVLSVTSIALLPVIALQGGVTSQSLWLGAMLLPSYAIGGLMGRRLFMPERAWLYRGTAYVIIGAAGIMGLPIWGG